MALPAAQNERVFFVTGKEELCLMEKLPVRLGQNS
jgi:hypothetical protein